MEVNQILNKHLISDISNIVKDYYEDTLFDRLTRIDEYKSNVFDVLIKGILNCTEISHIESGGREWNNKNQCIYKGRKVSDYDYFLRNPDVINPANWKYCLDWENFTIDYDNYEEYKEFEKTVDLTNINPNMITYKGTMVLKYGDFNYDVRGADECLLPTGDDFIDNVELTNPTLEEFAITLYRMKSHKWNYWYELFCYCNIKRKDDKLIIFLCFDHGS